MHRLKPLPELVDAQPLRREEHELQFGRLHARLDGSFLGIRDGRVNERTGVYAGFLESFVLVLHEGAQRVNHDSHSGLQQRC